MSEDKQYPIGGYAPGSYYNKCVSCNQQFQGDKRAWQCEPCAIKDDEHFKSLPEDEQRAIMQRNAKAFLEAWNKVMGDPNKTT